MRITETGFQTEILNLRLVIAEHFSSFIGKCLLHKLLLFLCEFFRDLYDYFNKKISPVIGIQVRHPLLPETKECMTLGTSRDFQKCSSRNCTHVDLTPEERCFQADIGSAVQICTLSLKSAVFFYVNDCIQISGRPLVLTRFAFTSDSKELFVFYATGD